MRVLRIGLALPPVRVCVVRKPEVSLHQHQYFRLAGEPFGTGKHLLTFNLLAAYM